MNFKRQTISDKIDSQKGNSPDWNMKVPNKNLSINNIY